MEGFIDELLVGARLSLQRALLGEVTPGIRVVGVEVTPERLDVWVYHDGPAGELAEEFDAGVLAQVVADFAYPERGDPEVLGHFVRCDAPQPVEFRGVRVYARWEPSAV